MKYISHRDRGPQTALRCRNDVLSRMDIGCSLIRWRRNEFESGGTRPAQSAGNFFGVPLHFLTLQVQLDVLVSAFVMVSTVWSVSCLLSYISRCPVAYGVGAGGLIRACNY